MKPLFIFLTVISINFCGSAQSDRTNAKVRYGSPHPSTPSKEATEDAILKEKGYVLNNRQLLRSKLLDNSCNAYGRIAVWIFVNKEGIVEKAISGAKGTTTNSSCLLELANKQARLMIFNPKNDQKELQKGTVLIRFKRKPD